MYEICDIEFVFPFLWQYRLVPHERRKGTKAETSNWQSNLCARPGALNSIRRLSVQTTIGWLLDGRLLLPGPHSLIVLRQCWWVELWWQENAPGNSSRVLLCFSRARSWFVHDTAYFKLAVVPFFYQFTSQQSHNCNSLVHCVCTDI